MLSPSIIFHTQIVLFFFNDTATTEIYTLSLHDALPIFLRTGRRTCVSSTRAPRMSTRLCRSTHKTAASRRRSEEHTSELQSQSNLVCRLLLEKKNNNKKISTPIPFNPKLVTGAGGYVPP